MKKRKRNIPNFILNIPDGQSFDVNELLNNQPVLREVVKEEIYSSIYDAFQNKKREAVLFNIPLQDEELEEVLVTIKKEKWKSSLKLILPFFEKKEKWENCVEIREMIKEL